MASPLDTSVQREVYSMMQLNECAVQIPLVANAHLT
jgi:hypothetical protein